MRALQLVLAAGLAFGLGGAAAADAIDEELAEEGQRVFRQCQACHMIGEGATNRVGPHLNEIIGRPAGSIDGFRYSNAMVEAGAAGLVWDETTLEDYLENPREKVPGTSMVFAGLRDERQRLAVIEYMKAVGGVADDEADGEAGDEEEAG